LGDLHGDAARVSEHLDTLAASGNDVVLIGHSCGGGVCANDFAIHPELQRIMAARCSRHVEWASDQSPFLSHPELVTNLLAELAES
jgi:alpha-beta hydrolase superfamily lysophospholipase